MNEVKGNVTVTDKQFTMSGDNGYGLINLYGKQTLIRFSCPLETSPPQGNAYIIGQSFKLDVFNGEFYYEGQLVHTEVK